MDTKKFFTKFVKALKENALITAIVGIAWLILGWLKSYGINSILLFPFNFISGALNGVDGGSFIGGIIGKTIVLMLLNNLLKPLMFTSGNNVERLSKSFEQFKASALSKIPQYKNIKQLFTIERDKRSYNFIGFGLAFLVYPFITGNGSFQNSGVCLLIAISLFKELKKQRSLMINIINSILKKFNQKQISKENINRIVSGNALGFACTVVFSIINQNNILPYSFGIIIIFIGILELNKAIKLQRIFCLTFAMFLFASNFSFAFASFIYDSSIHTMMDFDNSEYRDIIMANLGEIEEFNLYGADLKDIDSIELDRLSKKSFTVFNTSNSYTRMLYTISNMEWDNSGDTYGFDHNIKIDGVEYNATLIKEEITFTDLILKANQSTSGKFIYTGEYLLEPLEKQSDYSTKMIVTIEGDIYDHYYVHIASGNKNQLHLGLDLAADNNKATVDINGQIQKLPYADVAHNFSKEDLGKITVQFVAPVLIAEFINEKSSATPVKVTVAAVASVAMATSGSVALSSVSGSTGDLDLGEEAEESFENNHEENNTDDNKISHSMIINNNEALPILCNSTGAVVNIPMHIVDGENLTWNYVVIPYAPGGLGSFIPAVINPLGDNTTDLSLSFTGKKFEENSIQIICNRFATAKSDDEEHKAHGIVELTAYNLGLHAKIKNSNKNITKDNLTITYVKDSKFKGIAEIKQLKNNEYVIEFTEKTESQTIALITAKKSEYGSIVITTNKE